MPRPTRIAFVMQQNNNYNGRLMRGMSRFGRDEAGSASPGCLLREFLFPNGATDLPEGFEAWAPDAVCCALSQFQRPYFDLFKAGDRPLVHLYGNEPGPGEAVVTPDAIDTFSVIHDHFDQLGLEHRAMVCLLDAPGRRVRERYRDFCEQRGIPFDTLLFEDPNSDFKRPGRLPRWPKPLADWLGAVPKPAGLFTVNHYIGPYLARICGELGIAVPDELAIVGGDGFDISLWSDPPLTSVHYPLEQVGTEAVRVAHAMLGGASPPGQWFRLGGAQVVARGSTASHLPEGVDIPGAIRFIEAFTFEKINTQTVADLTQSVSRQTFVKHFKAWTRQSPAQAIRARKLDEAKRMLRDSDISVTALALACGYCDDVELRKVFVKSEGVPPSTYRASYRA